MSDLLQLQPGYGIESNLANKPAAGSYPYGRQPGNLWIPSDGSSPEILQSNGLGGYVWVALLGGGGVASVSAGNGVLLSGTAANPIVSIGFAGEVNGDLIAYLGGTWSRLPVGANPNGSVLSLVAGLPAWAPSAAGATLSGNNGVVVTGGPAYAATIGFVGQLNGDITFFDGANWTRLAVGNTYDQLEVFSGVPIWNHPGAFQLWDLYVAGTTGNDANGGRTPLTPVQTINRAMELVPNGVTGKVVIHSANEPVTETVRWKWFLPSGKAPSSLTIAIQAPLTEILPAEANTGGTIGLLNTFGTLLATSPLVPNAHDGQLLEYITAGANKGFYRIAENDATTLTICGTFPVAPTLGDTFRIVTDAVTVTLPPIAAGDSEAFIDGGCGLAFSGIDLQLNGNTLDVQTRLEFQKSSLRDASGKVRVGSRGSITNVTPALYPANVITDPVAPLAGLHCLSAIEQFGGLIDLYGMRLEASVFGLGGKTQLEGVECVGGTASVGQQSGELVLTGINSTGCTQTAFAYLRACGFGAVLGLDVQGAAGDGVAVEDNSYLTGQLMTGGAIAGLGVRCLRHSRVQCSDANVGTTIAGGAGAVQVGSNAAPATWAAIAGGAAADVLDLAAAVPTLAAVTT